MNLKLSLHRRLLPPLNYVPAMHYRVYMRRLKDPDYEREKLEYKQKMSEMRKKHLKDYWEMQTQVENAYLDKWRLEKTAKQRRDLDRWRTAICNVSMHTKNQLATLARQEREQMERVKQHDLKRMKRAVETKMMLEAMELDSKRWPTLAELNQKVNENVVLPQTILNYAEYYGKLQNLAFYAEQGDHEAMQKLLDKEDVMEKKNLLLQPLFRDLKSQIRHMSHTEEFKLLKEYVDARHAVLQNFPADSAKGQQGLALLQAEYAKLLANYKRSLQREPSKKLRTLQRRLEDLFQLLSLWTQYVEVVYMPEAELNVMHAVQALDARPEDTSLRAREEERDLAKRMKTLFGKDYSGLDEEPREEAAEEAYETVLEGQTSDTTEAPGKKPRRTRL